MAKISDKNFITARRNKIYKKRIWTFFKIILVLIFFIGIIWALNYFYNSSYFKIKNITVEGNKHYAAEDIISVIPELEGSNIFEINKKNIEDTILNDLIWIKEINMAKIFPDKVNFEIRERRPYLKIYNRGKYYFMDEEGMILDEIEKNQLDRYSNLLLVKNIIDYSLNIGEKIAIKNVLSCGKIFIAMDDELKSLIKEAVIDTDYSGQIVFISSDETKIIFGTSEDIIKKIEILKQILKEEAKYNIINLSNPDYPVVVKKDI